MTVRTILKKLEVTLTTDQKILLAAYDKARSNQGADQGVNPGKAEIRRGFFPQLLFKLEEITDWNLKTKKSVLDSMTLNLSPTADILYREYVTYLYKLLFASGLTTESINKDEQEDPRIVVCSLLSRLIGKVLSDSSVVEERINVLKAVEEFLQDPNLQQLFTVKKYLVMGNRVATPFLVKLVDESKENWFLIFHAEVRQTNLLKSNTNAIGNVIGDVRQIGFDIQAFLCGHLNPNVSSVTLHDNLALDAQLEMIENGLVKQADNYNNANEVMRSEYEKKILASLASDASGERIEKIRKLYKLFKENRELNNILTQTYSFISSTGWVLILRNVFDFNKLSDLIHAHYDERSSILKRSSDLRGTPAELGLLNRPTNVQHQNEIERLTALVKLNDESLKRYMKMHLLHSAIELIKMQGIYAEQFHFVNKTTVQHLIEMISPAGIASLATKREQQLADEVVALQAKLRLLSAKDSASQADDNNDVREIILENQSLQAQNDALAKTNLLLEQNQGTQRPLILSTINYDIKDIILAASTNNAKFFESLPREILDRKFKVTGHLADFSGDATALAVAANCRSVAVVDVLIQKRVNPFILCGTLNDSWIASYKGMGNGFLERKNSPYSIIYTKLKEYEKQYSTFAKKDIKCITSPTVRDACQAAFKNNIPWMETLIKQECELNEVTVSYLDEMSSAFERSDGEMTPLACAAKRGNIEMLKLLTDLGNPVIVDPFFRFGENKKALDFVKNNRPVYELISAYEEKYSAYIKMSTCNETKFRNN